MKILYEKKDTPITMWIGNGLNFPAHLHKEIELLYCLEGSISAECGGNKQTLNPSDCMLVLPNTIHSYETAASCKFILCILDPASFPMFRKYYSRSLTASVFSGGETEKLRFHFYSLLEEWNKDKNMELMISYISVILSILFKSAAFTDEKHAYRDTVLPDILAYLDQNYLLPLTLSTISAQFGMNPSYLSRLFSQYIDCPIMRYLHELRVGQAKYLLQTTDLSITDIAFECGFSTQRTFNRVFSSLTGTSPREFRKLYS